MNKTKKHLKMRLGLLFTILVSLILFTVLSGNVAMSSKLAPEDLTSPVYTLSTIATAGSDYSCNSVTVNNGQIWAGDYNRLYVLDSMYLTINAAKVSRLYTIDWYAETTLPDNQVTQLSVNFAAKYSLNSTQTLYLWNFKSSTWQELTSDIIGTSVTGIGPESISNPADYISANGNVRIRIYATNQRTFSVFADYLGINVITTELAPTPTPEPTIIPTVTPTPLPTTPAPTQIPTITPTPAPKLEPIDPNEETVTGYSCNSISVDIGKLWAGDYNRLYASDSMYLTIGGVRVAKLYTIDWYAEATLPGNKVSQLSVSFASKYSRISTQILYLYNFKNSTWQQLTSDVIGTSVTSLGPEFISNPSDYVSANGTVRVRIYASNQRSFSVSADYLSIGATMITPDLTVTINQAATQADLTNATAIHFTAVFSASVSDFTAQDVTLSGTAGATTASVTGSGTNYVVTARGMTSDGTVIATIGAGVAHDTYGKSNLASTSTDNQVIFDGTPPTLTAVSIASSNVQSNLAKPGDLITLSMTANEELGTLTALIAGHNSTEYGSGTTRTATYTMTSGDVDGLVAFVIAFTDVAGNARSVVGTTTDGSQVTFDGTAPTATINQATGQADPTDTLPVNFTVVFSEAVSDFTASDITLSGTAGAMLATVTGAGTTYNVAVSDIVSEGTMIASIAAGTVYDEAGNANIASTSTDNRVIYSTVIPVPGVASRLAFESSYVSYSSAYSPVEGIADMPVGTQQIVRIEDGYGNLVTTDNSTSVTVTITEGTGTDGATLSGTTTVIAQNGLAVFTDLNIDIDGIAYRLTAKSTPALVAATSDSFNVVTPTPDPAPSPSMAWGVNLAGLNFGDSAFQPGGIGWQTTYGDWYVKPTPEELDYFASEGMGLFRLSFRWERVQHSLYAELNPVDIGYIDDVVNEAAARGLKVYIEPHNYGRYFDLASNQTFIIGSAELPYDAFADLWRKLAEHYKNNPGIWGYDLMNEPYSMDIGVSGDANYLAGSENWKRAVQAAINAIREVDTETTIIVPGYFWSAAVMWPSMSDNLKDLVDPANNLIYEAHQYLDGDGSGWYGSTPASADLTIGPSRLKPFVDWLRANGKKGLIGEIGVPSDQVWLDTLKPALDYIVANRDVLVSVQFYAACPWYVILNYPLCLDPVLDADGNYIDKPQMTLISNYITY